MEVVVNCNVPNCDGKHNIVFIQQKAVIGMEEFFKIVNHWGKNGENICGKFCRYQIFCKPHRRFNFIQMFKNKILKNNANNRVKITKLEIKRDCVHDICMDNWCFNVYSKSINSTTAKNCLNWYL